MIRLHKTIAGCFGIGFIKGGGTLAAAVTAVAWWLLWKDARNDNIALVVTSLITAVGVWSANAVEPFWGKDSSRVVIDEVAGMCIALLFVTATWMHVLAALLLFRFFDIVKPLFIRRMEKLPGGWGVLADDVLAGIYANVILQVLIHTNVLKG